MRLFSEYILGFSYLLTLCQAQSYRYISERKSSNNVPSSSSYYNSASNPSSLNPYYKHFSQRSSIPYSSYKNLKTDTATSPYSESKFNSVNGSYENTSLNEFRKKDSSSRSGSKNNKRITKADAENAKFVGAENQENDIDGRIAHLKRRKFHRRVGGAFINPCSAYGRDVGRGITPPPSQQGRFLWDINVYNVYPQTPVGIGCGGYGGYVGGLGSGLLSDPVGPAYYPSGTGIANLLGLFAPGILQNSLAVTGRPQQFADYGQPPTDNNLHNDPQVDPNYIAGPASVPVRRPNHVFYDSAGAPPVTPAQLVGGISTTVNGIIQQLTGNVQPVYG